MANYADKSFTVNKIDKDGEVLGTMGLDVRVYPIADPKGTTKGYANINIDGMFGVSGVSIVEGKNGLFASMPRSKGNDGEWRDLVFPVQKGLREQLNEFVKETYSAALDALVEQHESTLDKIHEGQKAMKERAPAGADAPEKPKKKVKDHSGEEH
ncbi:hypothetical protein FACS189490_04250 [Clostridia bacterium]|nr:hypothetical protein FACS189490_04250 [Clostridia bacterium]